MSHETGIPPDDDLKARIADCKSSENVRVMKIKIENEQMIHQKSCGPVSDFSGDFSLLDSIVDDSSPCYLMLRTDISNNYGFEWILITYVPVSSKTREKMLYSSTKPAIKREFGGNQLKTEYFATEKSDLTYDSFVLSQDRSEKPFTEQEIELAKVKEQERQAMRGLGEKVKLSSNISFPPTEAACDAISDFKSETTNFAQFVINGADEVIDSVTSQSGVTLDGVDGLVPRDRATYNLYRVPASAADGFINDNPVIFLHGISSSGSVKEKMLFSSCKSTFLQLLASDVIGLAIDRKVEVDVNDDNITQEFLLSEVKVKQAEIKKKFEKPKAPGRQRTNPRA